MRGWHVGFLGHRGRETGPCERNERVSATSRFPLPGEVSFPFGRSVLGVRLVQGMLFCPLGLLEKENRFLFL